MSVRLEGEAEFHAAVERMIRATKPGKMEPIIFSAVQITSRVSRKEAPVGPTGSLKKAVRTKRLRRRFGKPAPAISAIDRKKAPHAHLVHDGTDERIGRRGRYRGKRFGRMTANPFHARAWDKTRGKALSHIEKKVKKLVEGAATRGY